MPERRRTGPGIEPFFPVRPYAALELLRTRFVRSPVTIHGFVLIILEVPGLFRCLPLKRLNLPCSETDSMVDDISRRIQRSVTTAFYLRKVVR